MHTASYHQKKYNSVALAAHNVYYNKKYFYPVPTATQFLICLAKGFYFISTMMDDTINSHFLRSAQGLWQILSDKASADGISFLDVADHFLQLYTQLHRATYDPPTKSRKQGVSHSKEHPIFPLPYVSVVVIPRSGRSRAKKKREAIEDRWVNCIIHQFNHIYNQDSNYQKTDLQPTVPQRRIIQNLRSCVDDLLVRALECPALQSESDLTGYCNRALRMQSSQYDCGVTNPSSELDLDKLDLPASDVKLDAGKDLPKPVREFWDHPENFIIPPDSDKFPAYKKPCSMIKNDDDLIVLLDRLYDNKMVKWVPCTEEFVFHHPHEHTPITGGMFGVHKAGQQQNRQRLISNLSPVNPIFDIKRLMALPEVRLPNLSNFKYLVIKDTSEHLYLYKLDVDNCFCNLSLDSSKLARFLALDCPHEIGERCKSYPSEAVKSGQRFIPVCTSLPQGASFSVLVAQGFMINQVPAWVSWNQNLINQPFSLGEDSFVWTLCIDDFILISDDLPIGLGHYKRVETHWLDREVPVKTLKNVEGLNNAAPKGQLALGHSIYDSGVLSFCPFKMIQNITSALYVLKNSVNRRSVRAKILGRCINMSLYNRGCLSLFTDFSCYMVDIADTDRDYLLSWTTTQVRELLDHMIQLPFCYQNLRCPFSSVVSITDACSAPVLQSQLEHPIEKKYMGIAGGYFHLDPDLVQKLSKQYDPKPTSAQTTNLILEDSAVIAERYRVPDCGEYLEQKRPWYFLAFREGFYSNSHIAFGELLTARLNLERKLSTPSRDGTREWCIIDNTPSVFCINRGRSSVRILNIELQRIHVIACATRSSFLSSYVSSAKNWFMDFHSRVPLECEQKDPSGFNYSKRPPPANLHDPSLHQSFDATCGYPGEGPNNQADPEAYDSDSSHMSDYGSDTVEVDLPDFTDIRKQVTKRLRTLNLQPDTVKRYESEVAKFNDVVYSKYKLSLDQLADRDQIDAVCAVELLEKYDVDSDRISRQERPRGPTKLLPAIVKQFPEASYPLSRRVQKQIMKRHKRYTRCALPLTKDQAYAILTYLITESLEAAIIFMLSWIGLLRCSEALKLRPSDIRFSTNRHKEIEKVTLSLNQTKTRTLDVAVSTCPIEVNVLHQLIEKHKNQLRRSKRFDNSKNTLTSLNYNSFKRKLDSVYRIMGYNTPHGSEELTAPLRYNTHSMRRGAATALYSAGRSATDLAVLGRWQCTDSLHCYLREGLALITEVRVEANSTYQTFFRRAQKVFGFVE